MPLSQTTFWWIVAGGAAIASTLGTAVYLNRRRLNKLWQRLFGMEADATDDGYIIEMDQKLDNLCEQMNEQHQQVYSKLEEMNGDVNVDHGD